MRIAFVLMILALSVMLFSVRPANAFIINEVLADPAAGLNGDANGDGVASANNDEFLEFFNTTAFPLDISGWDVNDAVKTRHVFPANTILPPQGLLVVFGGGDPQLTASPWQKASTGTLSLNNTSEVISLFDAHDQLIEQVIYGAEAGKDESIVRNPEGTGNAFVGHSWLDDSNGRIFSPGYLIHPPAPVTAAVPELLPFWSLAMGLGFVRVFTRR